MSARPQLLVKVHRVVEAKCSRSWVVWGVLPVHSVIFSVRVFCARSLSLCEGSLSLCIVPRKMPQGSKGHSLVLHQFQRTFRANPSPIALHKLRSAFSIRQACKSLVWVINGYSSALKMQNKDWLGWVHRTSAPQEKERTWCIVPHVRRPCSLPQPLFSSSQAIFSSFIQVLSRAMVQASLGSRRWQNAEDNEWCRLVLLSVYAVLMGFGQCSILQSAIFNKTFCFFSYTSSQVNFLTYSFLISSADLLVFL